MNRGEFRNAIIAVLVLALGIAAIAVNSALHLHSSGLQIAGGLAIAGALLSLL